MRIQIALLTAAAVMAFAAPAFAQEDAAPSIKVSLAGLDLSSHEGAAAAMQRIDAAAIVVCGDRPDIRDLSRQVSFERCHRSAVNGAVKAVDRPLLSRAASSETPPVLVAAR